jgi:uncharacterized protein (TIGR01777 family)
MRIFVTGGTGLIGTHLVERLIDRGDQVLVLTRRPDMARQRFGERCRIVEGDPMQRGTWQNEVGDCHAAINLAGEPIFGRRWNSEFKALLVESRLKSTNHVLQALMTSGQKTGGDSRALVNASAIGFYGPRGDEELSEESSAGSDFLARLTVDWENAAYAADAQGIRVSVVRIGVVLDKAGGALSQMLTPFRLGLGGPVGSGNQWLSWIHHEDVVGILMLALDRYDVHGAMNATAPQPVTNREFARELGRALHRPAFLPAPKFALRLKFGEVADILTTGQRVLPRKAESLGYEFRFPTIDRALQNILCQS